MLKSDLNVLTVEGNVRLSSYISNSKNEKGVWIILHGWGGSSSSVYTLKGLDL